MATRIGGSDDGQCPFNSNDNVENILSKELLELSFKDRNDIQEEIHGVHCVAPKETPEFIHKSLYELSLVLESEDFLPTHPKRAYRRSIEIQQRLETEAANKSLYVFEDDFRLRFLRFELFDINKAAQRMIIFLDLLVIFFGEYALERPICLSDFSEQEIEYIKRGYIQFMPFRDRSGRRIISYLPNDGYDFFQPFIRAKTILYISWTAGHDVETQQRGLVFIAWFDSNFTAVGGIRDVANPADLLSVRASAIHICSPDIPFISQFKRYVLPILLGRNNRIKTRIHLGSSIELKYQLRCYGIPVDLIPISWNGKLKTVYLDQWMRARKAIESREYDKVDGDRTSRSDIIECPMINDVIFKQGTSLVTHPGNAFLRSMIEIKNKAQEEEGRRVIKMKRRRLVLEIYEEITSRHKGRFLIWNHDSGLWSELKDREQILPRIEYLVKEHRKSIKAGQRRKEANRRRVVDNLEKSDIAFRSFATTAPLAAGRNSSTTGNRLYNDAQWSRLSNTMRHHEIDRDHQHASAVHRKR